MKTRLTMFQKATNSERHRLLLSTLVCVWVVTSTASTDSVMAQQNEVVDRIVAVVNSEIITLYDLNRAFRPYEANIKALQYPPEKERQTLFQVRTDLLNQLIDSQLADQQIKREQITVTKKEIDTTIERIKEARSFTDEQLREGLTAQGITMEEYRKEIESQILRTKLVNREVKSKIVITKEDIKSYYDSHQENYAGAKKYYLWNIFIRTSGSGKNAALEEIKAVEAKLKQGISFDTMVDQLNESSSAVQGNDLGLYRRDELSEELRTVVVKLKAGEFSEILETDFGYQIIYVQKIEATAAKPFGEVEGEIQETLYSELVEDKYQEWLEDLRARSHIRIIQ